MNHADCVIKRDVYLQNMHSCSKNIRSISVFVLKISVVYQKYIMGDIAWIFASLKDKQHSHLKIKQLLDVRTKIVKF